ncbi:MAG: hypothetical protein GX937_06295 [Lentisphaerae bacterium]|jgi:hypothetical protein|nr:hypothetical protein [Lentisphaerota bacterium]
MSTAKPYFAYRSFWKEPDAKRRFAAAGIKQFCVFAGNTVNSLGEPYCQYDMIWKWWDTYDFTPFDEQMQDTLDICPDAEILCIIDLNSPLWLARQLTFDSYPQVSVAVANDRWRQATEKYLNALLEHIQKKYSKHIACFIMMCGVTDEWMDYCHGQASPEKLRLFQAWAEERNLPIPEDIPGIAARFAAPRLDGALRDPVLNRDAVNYWRFSSDLIADAICHFAGLVDAHRRPGQEIGAFYGYIMELTGNRLVQCGHLAYEKVEASPLIDFVISPGNYSDRTMGGGSGFMTPNGTVHVHGKNCMYEIDHRTHTANMQLTEHVALPWMIAWKNAEEDIAGLRREFCRALFHGASLWWFDMWGHFYDDPAVMQTIADLLPLWRQYADRTRQPQAEVALIVDPVSTALVNDQHYPLVGKLYNGLHTALNRLGAPFVVHSFGDLPKIDVSAFKLVILSGCIEVTPEKRAILDRCLPADRPAQLWIGPSALTDGTTWGQQPLNAPHCPDVEAVTPELLRQHAEAAGVHIFVPDYTPVWAADDLLMIHVAEGGERIIALPRQVKTIREIFSNTVITVNADHFNYTFKTPETALFALN